MGKAGWWMRVWALLRFVLMPCPEGAGAIAVGKAPFIVLPGDELGWLYRVRCLVLDAAAHKHAMALGDAGWARKRHR